MHGGCAVRQGCGWACTVEAKSWFCWGPRISRWGHTWSYACSGPSQLPSVLPPFFTLSTPPSHLPSAHPPLCAAQPAGPPSSLPSAQVPNSMAATMGSNHASWGLGDQLGAVAMVRGGVGGQRDIQRSKQCKKVRCWVQAAHWPVLCVRVVENEVQGGGKGGTATLKLFKDP